MFVNAIYGKTVEHIKWPHPLGVTLCKVVVHSYYVNTVACKCVEEYRTCSYQCLTLTCCHLGNLTLMKHDTTEELHVIMDHLPLEVIASCCPMVVIDSLVAVNGNKVLAWVCCKFAVEICCCYDCFLVLSETTCCILYNAEYYWENFVQSHFVFFEYFLVEFVNLCKDAFALIDWSLLNLCLQFLDLLLQVVCGILYVCLYLLRLCTELIVRESLNGWICSLYFLYEWLYLLYVTACLIAEKC